MYMSTLHDRNSKNKPDARNVWFSHIFSRFELSVGKREFPFRSTIDVNSASVWFPIACEINSTTFRISNNQILFCEYLVKFNASNDTMKRT